MLRRFASAQPSPWRISARFFAEPSAGAPAGQPDRPVGRGVPRDIPTAEPRAGTAGRGNRSAGRGSFDFDRLASLFSDSPASSGSSGSHSGRGVSGKSDAGAAAKGDDSSAFRSVGRGSSTASPFAGIAASFGSRSSNRQPQVGSQDRMGMAPQKSGDMPPGRGTPRSGAGRGAGFGASVADRFALDADEPASSFKAPAPAAVVDMSSRLGIFTPIAQDLDEAAHVPGGVPSSRQRRVTADSARTATRTADDRVMNAVSDLPPPPPRAVRDEKSYVLDSALSRDDLLSGLADEEAQALDLAYGAILSNPTISSHQAEHVLRWGRNVFARARDPKFIATLNALVTPRPEWEIEAENAEEAAAEAAASAAEASARMAAMRQAAAADEADAKAKEKDKSSGKGGAAAKPAEGKGDAGKGKDAGKPKEEKKKK